MDTRYWIFIGVFLVVAACGGKYTGLFSREGSPEWRRYLRFIVIFVFVLPVIYSAMTTILAIVQSDFPLAPGGPDKKVLSQVPLFIGTMLYMIVFTSMVGAILASPFTFTVSLILAPVNKWLLDRKPAKAGMMLMFALDGIAFAVGAAANGLMMSGWFDQGFVPPVEIKFLLTSVLAAGISAVICNRIAGAWVRRSQHCHPERREGSQTYPSGS